MKAPRIASRLTLWLVVLSLLPIVLLSGLYLHTIEDHLKQQAAHQLSTAADHKAADIEDYAEERLRDARLLARSPEAQRAMVTLDAIFHDYGPDSEVYRATEGEYRDYFARLLTNGEYQDVFLVNTNGEVVFSVQQREDFGTNLLTGALADSELARSIRETFSVLGSDITDFRYYPPSDGPAAFISAPLIADRRLLGAVALQVNPAEINHVVGDNTLLGRSGETLVAQHLDGVLTLMAPTPRIPDADLTQPVDPLSAAYRPLLAALGGERGGGLIEHPDHDIIAAWRYLPSLRWGMLVKVDRDEALAPVAQLQAAGLIIMGLLILAVLTTAYFLGRSIVRPIAQLTAASTRIADGEADRRVPVSGFAEARQLGTSFNTMTEHLQMAQQQLEDRVTERTRQLANANERLREEMQQHALANAKLRQAAKVFDHSSEAILIADADFRIIDSNKAFREVSGYRAADLLGQLPELVDNPADNRALLETIAAAVNRDGSWSGEIRNRRRDGETFPVWMRVNAVTDPDGAVVNYVALFSDISHIKEAEQRLEKLAYYDFMTGLPNRLLFRERLQRAIAAGRRHEHHTALLFIDLDRFKTVNDSLGHDTGDKLLVVIAERLQTCVRDNDTVARLGGDEFTIILNDLASPRDAAQVARKVIEVCSEPVLLAGHEVVVGCSIGIAVAPNDGRDDEVLISNADIAMYHAKDRGRGNFQFFTEAMNRHAHEQLLLETGLRRALKEQQLELLYQPLVDLRNREPVGLEVLLRWHHPYRGILGPRDFLDVAEDSGLILSVGDWVLETACQQVQRWASAGLDAQMLAINLSRRQFQDPELAKRIQRTLERTAIRPEQVQFEVSEDTIIADPEQVVLTLEQLTQMGLHIALDDFGTGHSSLTLLRKFQTCCLKIDRSFIRDLPDDPDARAITSAVITLATKLGLQVVAEGVETEAQRDYLVAQGCAHAQGYLFAGALTATEVESYLRRCSA